MNITEYDNAVQRIEALTRARATVEEVLGNDSSLTSLTIRIDKDSDELARNLADMVIEIGPDATDASYYVVQQVWTALGHYQYMPRPDGVQHLLDLHWAIKKLDVPVTMETLADVANE